MYGKTYDTGGGQKEFKIVEKGKYAAYLDDVKIEASKSGTPYIQFVCKIDGGEFDGQKLWHKIWFTDKAYNMAAQQLDNLLLFDKIPAAKNIKAYMNNAADACFKLVNKKIEIEVTGHNEAKDKNGNMKKYPNHFITGYLDIPNMAIQTEPKKKEGFDKKEELPF